MVVIDMAIVIPSSKTYNKQNPKVRDNVIERIEVNAQEVVPDNEYETTVYNKNFIVSKDIITDEEIKNTEVDGMVRGASAEGMSTFYYSASYVGYLEQKTINISVKIPILLINKYVDTILTKTDANGNENINYSLFGVEEKGGAWAEWDYETAGSFVIKEGSITYASPDTVSEEKRLEIPDNISIYERSNPIVVSSSAEQNLKTWGNVKTAEARKEIVDGEECFVIDLQLMGGARVVKMTYYSQGDQPAKISFEGDYTLFNATAVEIGIRGNIIGIDLEDNTLYIPKTDKTSKKVYSFYGNELMQTSNYIFTEENKKIPAIETMYGKTQQKYLLGKETATIRCSIGDYFYENGDLGISINKTKKNYDNSFANLFIRQPSAFYELYATIENPLPHDLYIDVIYTINFELSTTLVIKAGQTSSNFISIGYVLPTNRSIVAIYYQCPMSFKMYDKIMPMVYGVDGKDRPMSLYKDGSGKVFQVLGSKIYYDGAVWQELSLQEIDKNEIL